MREEKRTQKEGGGMRPRSWSVSLQSSSLDLRSNKKRFLTGGNTKGTKGERRDPGKLLREEKQRKRITEPEMRYYLKQLVHSLQYLREHLVIHRDLKLGNLFLDNQMRVKVGDFGLAARLTYETERKKTVCGTPNYIAPEILRSETGHSFEVDIWSTGVILYTLLVGKPPFQCKDVKTTYDKILSNVYTYPDHVLLSHEVKSLINKMLQHYPANRIGLNDILEDSFFTASHAFTPTSLPESTLRHCPHIEDLTPKSTLPLPSAYISSKTPHHDEKAPTLFSQDENDPHALNRVRPASNHQPLKPTHTGVSAATGAGVGGIKSGLGGAGAYVAPSRPKSAGPMQRRAFQIFDDVPRDGGLGTHP
ncbi:hypothetical protein EON64_18850, partial [archaeon]